MVEDIAILGGTVLIQPELYKNLLKVLVGIVAVMGRTGIALFLQFTLTTLG